MSGETMAQGMFKLKDNVKRLMECHHPPWSNQYVAKATRVDEGYVSQVFRGKKPPSWKFLRALAELTGLHDGGELIYYDSNGVKDAKRKRKKGGETP